MDTCIMVLQTHLFRFLLSCVCASALLYGAFLASTDRHFRFNTGRNLRASVLDSNRASIPSVRLREFASEISLEERVKRMCTDSPIFQLNVNIRLACRYFIHAKGHTLFLPDNLAMQGYDEFKFPAVAESVCGSAAIELIIIAHSAPKNSDKRNAIRNTWGAEIEKRFNSVRVAFLSGESMIDAVNRDLRSEASLSGDLILVEMLDQYHKLTLKHMLLLRWVQEFCPQAKYIMKCDDDIMVNPSAYDEVKQKILDEEKSTKQMFGRMIRKAKPMRASSKWGTPTDFYPFDFYPDYFLGPAVIIGRDAARKLLELGRVVPFMGIDDVYINGILPGLGNITTVSTGDLVYAHRPSSPLEGSPKFSWLKKNAEDIEKEWNEALSKEAEAKREEDEMLKLEEEKMKKEELKRLQEEIDSKLAEVNEEDQEKLENEMREKEIQKGQA